MEPILKVENLVKRYAKRNLVGAPQDFLALDNVSFTLPAGTTLAIVGESGSGKSTLASCVACLETATAGNLWFGGLNLARATENELRTLRPQIQLIVRDPEKSAGISGEEFEVHFLLHAPNLIPPTKSCRPWGV